MADTITIPLPSEIPIGYGIYSTAGPNGCMIVYRSTVQEREFIAKAAAKLGITSGTFMRRVIYDSAKAVMEMIEPDTTENIISET